MLKIIKELKGKLPQPNDVTTLKNGNIQITINNSPTIEVSPEVYTVYQDETVRKAVGKVVKPVTTPGINKLEIRENKEVVEAIEKQDAEAFLQSQPPVMTEIDSVEETERVVSLEIVRLYVKGDNKWSLTDGTVSFNVDMEDEEFLKKIDRGEVFFKKGDILRVRFLTRARRTKDGLKSEYVVREVLEF